MNRANLKPQIVTRVFGPIPGEQRGQQVETRRRRRPQADAADGPACNFLHAFVRAVDGPENTSCFLQEDFAGDRQRHAARGPIQKLRAEFLLEQRDLVGNGRLRQVAEAGRPCEMPQFSDGHERPQLTQLHSWSLSDGFNHFIGRIEHGQLDWPRQAGVRT